MSSGPRPPAVYPRCAFRLLPPDSVLGREHWRPARTTPRERPRLPATLGIDEEVRARLAAVSGGKSQSADMPSEPDLIVLLLRYANAHHGTRMCATTMGGHDGVGQAPRKLSQNK